MHKWFLYLQSSKTLLIMFHRIIKDESAFAKDVREWGGGFYTKKNEIAEVAAIAICFDTEDVYANDELPILVGSGLWKIGFKLTELPLFIFVQGDHLTWHLTRHSGPWYLFLLEKISLKAIEKQMDRVYQKNQHKLLYKDPEKYWQEFRAKYRYEDRKTAIDLRTG